MRSRGRRIRLGLKNRREPPGGNSVVTKQHEGNEYVDVVPSPADSLCKVICTVPYVPAFTWPILGQHQCYTWIVILNISGDSCVVALPGRVYDLYFHAFLSRQAALGVGNIGGQ